jgi:hypothetical protein
MNIPSLHIWNASFSASHGYMIPQDTIVGRLSVWIHGHRTMETRTQKTEPQSMSSYSSLAATERFHRRTFRREFSSSTYEFPSSREYYDEMFDTYYYQPTKDWAAYIMLVGWKGDYAVRILVGQIHAEAWLHVRRGSSWCWRDCLFHYWYFWKSFESEEKEAVVPQNDTSKVKQVQV